jgi:PAS domain S-box-containing protein
MRIGTKLLLSFLTVGLLVLITGGLSYYLSNEIKNELISESSSTAVQLQKLTEMSVQLQNSLLYTRNYLTERGKQRAGNQSLSVAAQIRQSEEIAEQSLENFEDELLELSSEGIDSTGAVSGSSEVQEEIISLTDSLQQSFSYYDTLIREMFELEREASFGDEMFNVTIEPYFRNTLLPILLQLRSAYYERVGLQLGNLQDTAANTVRNIIFYTVLAFIIALLLAFLVYRSISRPIKKLTLTAKEVGDGDLSRRIELNTRDELANLADTFNKMAENLSRSMVSRTYVNNIIQSMGEMLIVTNDDGQIKIVNRAVGEKLGFEADELTGESFWHLLSGEQRESIREVVNADGSSGGPMETRFVTRKGDVIPVNLSYTIISDQMDEESCIYVASDISRQKQAEEKISESLKEKDVLLAEIHHRVKNNLAVISGLIEMQVWNLEDEEVRSVLRDSQLRIQSIALVHEKLYQTENFANIQVSDYIKELVLGIADSFSDPDIKIENTFDCENVGMNINQAIPFSLLLNEGVVNAYKHAFVGLNEGVLHVELKQDEENIVLTISDDGVGIEEEGSKPANPSLGMKLIETLTIQLDGEYKLQPGPDGGTLFEVRFPAAQGSFTWQ